MAADQAPRSRQSPDRTACSTPRCQPEAPWTEDMALQIWVDAEHEPIVIRLSVTLSQATAVNVVPVVRELIGDGARDFELQTPALSVPDVGGTGTLDEVQRLVRRSGGRCTWDGITIPSGDVSPPFRVGQAIAPLRYGSDHCGPLLAEVGVELPQRASHRERDTRQVLPQVNQGPAEHPDRVVLKVAP